MERIESETNGSSQNVEIVIMDHMQTFTVYGHTRTQTYAT